MKCAASRAAQSKQSGCASPSHSPSFSAMNDESLGWLKLRWEPSNSQMQSTQVRTYCGSNKAFMELRVPVKTCSLNEVTKNCVLPSFSRSPAIGPLLTTSGRRERVGEHYVVSAAAIFQGNSRATGDGRTTGGRTAAARALFLPRLRVALSR